ncbi:hypothetical protein BDA96_03G323700 [Sorghum bicolor]|uniref:Uncharacterized protein n=2 Tax=Sorghum bicolor TaxID=4558 RepID=A0A921RGU5_SORBI|nr:hypothetical protein BDA96_03G323700 [Sorghum bicolor]OQU87572.1 hypothetical protein SORBI_3003G299901 [Sorghum bicolor]
MKWTANKRGGGPETETDGTMISRITKPHTYREEALRAIDMSSPAHHTTRARLRARIVSVRPLQMQSAADGGDQFAMIIQQRQPPARSPPTSPTACPPSSISLGRRRHARLWSAFCFPQLHQALVASGDEWMPVAMLCVTPSPEGNQVAVTPTAVIRPKLPTPFRFSHTFGPIHGPW